MKYRVLWTVLFLAFTLGTTHAQPLEDLNIRNEPKSSHKSRRSANMPPPSDPSILAGPRTLGLMTGELGGTFLQIGADLTAVINDDKLRVVPIMGKGSLANIGDLLNLRGVDMALVASDAIRYATTHKLYPGLNNRISYIAKLYDQDVHVLAHKEIRSIQDLKGKKVNIDVKGSGTSITAEAVFQTLNIPATLINDPPSVGLENLKSGKIDAIVYVIGKPGSLFTNIPKDSGLHLLPIESETLMETYLPSTFTHEDYPSLVSENQQVSTLSVSVMLTAYNWPKGSDRYKALEMFTATFFQRFDGLKQKPHHPKWREVNLAATVPGWKRAPYAEEALMREKTQEDSAEFEKWIAVVTDPGNISSSQRLQLWDLWKNLKQ